MDGQTDSTAAPCLCLHPPVLPAPCLPVPARANMGGFFCKLWLKTHSMLFFLWGVD